MKVKIKCWNGVATWLWVANDENCGICRMAFNGCCPDCKVPGDDCPLVWGQCSHCFHMHCILKWLHAPAGAAALPHVPPGMEVQGVRPTWLSLEGHPETPSSCWRRWLLGTAPLSCNKVETRAGAAFVLPSLC
nr:HSPC214 [Homo sapiens]